MSTSSLSPVRVLAALLAWAAAIAGGVALAVLAADNAKPKHHTTTSASAPGDTTGDGDTTTRAIRPSAPAGRLDVAKALAGAPLNLTVDATSPDSLLRAAGLARQLARLHNRYAGHTLVAGAILRPAELDLVVAAGTDGHLVRVPVGGRMSVGPALGSLRGADAVYISQLKAAVPQRFARAIAARHGGTVTKMVLALGIRGHLAGWRIYSSARSAPYTALLAGQGLRGP